MGIDIQEQVDQLNILMDELAGLENEDSRFASICYRPDPQDIYFDEDSGEDKVLDIEEGFWLVPFEKRHFGDFGDYLGRNFKQAEKALRLYAADCW